MKRTIADFAYSHLWAPPPAPNADLTGKVVLITGANTGIGYEAAKHFAKLKPAKVIIACRSKERGEAALAKLKQETGESNIYLRLLDLGKFSSVIEFANKFVEEEERLDIHIANASIATVDYRVTEDGWESALQINNLSTFLSTILLLPLMLKTAKISGDQPRLLIIGSTIHYWAALEDVALHADNSLKMLSDKEYCKPAIMFQRYADTKLISLLMNRHLANNYLSTTPLVASVVCPGWCQSDIRRELGPLNKFLLYVVDLFVGRTSEEGSRQYVWTAVQGLANKNPKAADKLRGEFVESMHVAESSDWSLSEEGRFAEEKIWNEMIEELTKIDSRVPSILAECANWSAQK